MEPKGHVNFFWSKMLQSYRIFAVMKLGFTAKKPRKILESADRFLMAALQFNTRRPVSYRKGLVT